MTDPDTSLEDTDAPQDAHQDAASGQAFERLLEYLRDSRAFDFTGYKRPSLMRRVEHRMREIGVRSFEDYQDALTLRPDEFTALFNAILINVTSFFRDEDAWTCLAEQVVPALVARSNESPVRVWSAGCAAGQEAYSLAMLLHDALGDEFRRRVKIYATDVDDDALTYARQAGYTERELRGLPAHFRDRYFDAAGERWIFRPDVRRSVIFGRNDLTRDAPISRIDLLCCRNTLMYFNAETQARIVTRLGFALRPDGALFLGKAEMLLNHSGIFDAVDLKHRIFRKTGVAELHPSAAAVLGRGPRTGGSSTVSADQQLSDELLLASPVAQLAITPTMRVAMVNRRAASFLGLGDRDLGRPFQDLELSYRPVELRAHAATVLETRLPVVVREVEWRRSGPDVMYVDINIIPLFDPLGTTIGVSISFTDITRFRQLQQEVELANRQLETAYEELQSTNEELETTNEELQSTVEELETTNEELQSTVEELETMNGELQAANDDMQVANDELARRTVEVDELNTFSQSILGSIDSAVVVVDRDLVVRAWTTRAEDLWGLRAEETVGAHLLNLDSGLPAAQLHASLRAVIAGADSQRRIARLPAVNRRGRTIELRVTVSALRSGGSTSGALLLMESILPDDPSLAGPDDAPATDGSPP